MFKTNKQTKKTKKGGQKRVLSTRTCVAKVRTHGYATLYFYSTLHCDISFLHCRYIWITPLVFP